VGFITHEFRVSLSISNAAEYILHIKLHNNAMLARTVGSLTIHGYEVKNTKEASTD